jgi:hypothetical protein
MTRLADWIEYGRARDCSKRKVRQWLNEARGRTPIIFERRIAW